MKILIRLLRLIISILLIYVSCFFLKDTVSPVFNNNLTHIVIDGWASLWAQIGCVFLGVLMLIMTILTKGSWRESKFNKIYGASLLVSCLVISPLITLFIGYQINNKKEGFVECKELRKSSRRYSSRTYAVSELVCERLLEERDRKRSGWETD